MSSGFLHAVKFILLILDKINAPRKSKGHCLLKERSRNYGCNEPDFGNVEVTGPTLLFCNTFMKSISANPFSDNELIATNINCSIDFSAGFKLAVPIHGADNRHGISERDIPPQGKSVGKVLGLHRVHVQLHFFFLLLNVEKFYVV